LNSSGAVPERAESAAPRTTSQQAGQKSTVTDGMTVALPLYAYGGSRVSCTGFVAAPVQHDLPSALELFAPGFAVLYPTCRLLDITQPGMISRFPGPFRPYSGF